MRNRDFAKSIEARIAELKHELDAAETERENAQAKVNSLLAVMSELNALLFELRAIEKGRVTKDTKVLRG